MLEGFDSTVSYVPVSGMLYIHIIIAIASAEGLIILVLDIYNASQNTFIPSPKERVYLILSHLYLEWFKIKWTKHPLSSGNQKDICIKPIKQTKVKKPAVKFWYDLLK